MSSNYQGLHLKCWELSLAATTTKTITLIVKLKSNQNNSNLESLKIDIISAYHIFSMYQQNRSTNSWDGFQWKRLIKATKIVYSNKGVSLFAEFLIVFPTKVELLFFFYLMTLMCVLLYLVRQSGLPKSFLRTLILMTQVSL